MLKITPRKITKIVLFIIFIIVVARLLYVILVVMPDHPEKTHPLSEHQKSQPIKSGQHAIRNTKLIHFIQ